MILTIPYSHYYRVGGSKVMTREWSTAATVKDSTYPISPTLFLSFIIVIMVVAIIITSNTA